MNGEVGNGGVCPVGRILACKEALSIHEQRGELEREMIVTVERTRRRPAGGRQKMRHTTKIRWGRRSPLGKATERETKQRL